MVMDAGYEGSLTALPEWTKRIERSGIFSGLWLSDTSNDPFLLSTLAATSSESMLIGTNIAVAFARSPYCLAQTSYNLSGLSNGRFVLGLGTQVRAHIERRFGMEWPARPVAALKEYVSLLRHLHFCFQKHRRPDFKGEFYSCTLNSPVFSPDKHGATLPQIGFSAVGPLMTKAAGETADLVFLHPFTHRDYLQEVTLPNLKEGKKHRCQERAELIVVGSTFCLADDGLDFETQQRAVFGRLAFYASTPSYQGVLNSLGLEDLHLELHQLSRQGKWMEMARLLPREFVEACVVIAPRAELEHRIQERFGDIYDRVVVDPTHFMK